MNEKHFAYRISRDPSGLVCTQSEFDEDKMLDVLNEINKSHAKGIFWIFKQLNGKPQKALCIIDCEQNRIYYHYSGVVDDLEQTIKNLSHKRELLS
jgi:hypothetical protein